MTIWISTDIEADGPIPGAFSMLSFASVALDDNKKVLGTFSVNLKLLPDAKQDPETMAFWAQNQAAYDATRVNTVDPKFAFENYRDWLDDIPGQKVFVGYPAVYDFKWIDWYSVYFLGKNPFGFSRALDMKTMSWVLLSQKNQRVVSIGETTKKNMPRHWFDPLPHTHIAEDDALEQGMTFINMMEDILKKE